MNEASEAKIFRNRETSEVKRLLEYKGFRSKGASGMEDFRKKNINQYKGFMNKTNQKWRRLRRI